MKGLPVTVHPILPMNALGDDPRKTPETPAIYALQE
jgi:hypothetical protein